MSDKVKNSRRRFLLGSGAALGGALVGAAALADAAKKAPEAKKGGDAGKGADLPLVDPKSTLAVTLKYDHDAAKVPANLKVAKAGVEGSKQTCSNCMFYTKAGTNGGEEVGKCQLFPQGHVTAKGWCASWTKKP